MQWEFNEYHHMGAPQRSLLLRILIQCSVLYYLHLLLPGLKSLCFMAL